MQKTARVDAKLFFCHLPDSCNHPFLEQRALDADEGVDDGIHVLNTIDSNWCPAVPDNERRVLVVSLHPAKHASRRTELSAPHLVDMLVYHRLVDDKPPSVVHAQEAQRTLHTVAPSSV